MMSFFDWLKDKYANSNIGEVKAKGVLRIILTLEHTTPGVLRLDMTDNVKSMVEDFPRQV